MMERYTKFPNDLLDWLLAKSSELSKREIVILLAIVRNTIGWNKQKSQMSCRFITKQTGIAAGHVSDTLKQLEQKDLIILDRSKGTTIASINLAAILNGVTDSVTGALPVREQECYQFGNEGVTDSVSKVLPIREQINTERQIKENNKDTSADWLSD